MTSKQLQEQAAKEKEYQRKKTVDQERIKKEEAEKAR